MFGPDILDAAEDAGHRRLLRLRRGVRPAVRPAVHERVLDRGPAPVDDRLRASSSRRADFASQGGPTDDLRGVLRRRRLLHRHRQQRLRQPTFLGNHDMGRIGYFLQRVDQPGASDAELLARSQARPRADVLRPRPAGRSTTATSRASPATAATRTPARTCSPTPCRSYEDNDLIGTDETTSDDNFDPTHPLYQAIRDYAHAVRPTTRRCRTGAQIHRYSSDGPGVYAFSRIDRDERRRVRRRAQQQRDGGDRPGPDVLARRRHVPPRVVRTERQACRRRLTTGADGALSVTVPPLGFVIYQADGPGAAEPRRTRHHHHEPRARRHRRRSRPRMMDGHDVVDRIEVARRARRPTRWPRSRSPSARATATTCRSAPTTTPRTASSTTPAISAARSDTTLVVPRDRERPVRTPRRRRGRRTSASSSRSRSAPGDAVRADPLQPPGRRLRRPHHRQLQRLLGPAPVGRRDRSRGGDRLDRAEAVPRRGRVRPVRVRPSWPTTRRPVNFIVHRATPRTRTTAPTAASIPATTPEIWLRQGDVTIYTSQAEAQGYATVHYACARLRGRDARRHQRGGPVVTGAPPDAIDDYGAVFRARAGRPRRRRSRSRSATAAWSTSTHQVFTPTETPTAWFQPGEQVVHPSRARPRTSPRSTTGARPATTATRRAPISTTSGACTCGPARPPRPPWTDPLPPSRLRTCSASCSRSTLVDGAEQLAYILHRGDTKDPGPDQFLVFDTYGHEVWQLQGADPENPYVAPLRN